MALTKSNMLELGTIMPEFKLIDVRSKQIMNSKIYCTDYPVFVGFICNHCPYVQHIIEKMAQVITNAQKKGIQCVLINSNDTTAYPEDAPNKMKQFAKKNQLSCPYCYDASQEIARTFKAACTPECYLFDEQHKLIYRGRFDAAAPGNTHEVTGKDLIHAIDQYLSGKPNTQEQIASIGCNIKWYTAQSQTF